MVFPIEILSEDHNKLPVKRFVGQTGGYNIQAANYHLEPFLLKNI